MALNFNTSPYFDDFDKDSGFLRILFNPGRAVQARELTQIQSILQNQVRAGADHIFKDGTAIVGSDVGLNIIKFVKLVEADVDWNGRVIEGTISGAIAKIIKIHPDEAEPIYYIQELSGIFSEVEDVRTYDTICNSGVYDENGYCEDNTWFRTGLETKTGTVIDFGSGLEATINNGIYYIGGEFAPVLEQTIWVNPLEKYATAVVGFDIEEKIIEANSDERLLDPATGFYNQNAPGADRYYINMKLTTKEESIDTFDFLPIITVVDGSVTTKVKRTDYSTIIEELAQRTYDESGDYTTQSFPIQIIKHPTDDSQYGVKINPGKAYVRGHENELLSSISIYAEKARTSKLISNDNIKANFGPYYDIESASDVGGIFDVFHKEKLTFITNATYTGTEVLSTVGTSDRRITHFTEFGNGFRIYLDQPTGLDVVTDATFIVSSANPSVYVKLHRPTGRAVAQGTFAPWLYNIQPMTANVISGQTNYYTQKDFNVNLTGNSVAVAAGFGSMHWDKILLIWNTTDNILIPKNAVNISTGLTWEAVYSNENVTINIIDAATGQSPTGSDYNGHDLRVLANMYISLAQPRTISEITFSDQQIDLNIANKLMLPYGVFEIESIKDSISNVDVSDDFFFVKGNYDTEFENAYAIYINEDEAAIPGTTYKITYKAYQIGNTTNATFLNVNSYENGTIAYDDIHTYKAYYEPYGDFRLADVLDFRHTPLDFDTGTFLPLVDSNITISYEYYMPRADRLTLNTDGEFSIKQGFASEAAMLPKELDSEMTLYNFYVPPYTYDIGNISATFVDQKNYTMADLRELEERIDSLEYYTSLNLLEQTTESMQVLDENGLERYKNGMLVDSFTDHGIGDISNEDYFVSIYPEGGVCTTPFEMKGYDLEVTEYSGLRKNGRTWTLDFSLDEGWISQQFASQMLNLNPFAKLSWIGFLEISPQSDTWFEEEYASDVIVQNENNNNVRRQVELFGTQTRWNSWKTTWTGWSDNGGKKDYVAGSSEVKWAGRTANVHPGWGGDRPVDVNAIDGKIGPDGHSNINGFTLDKIWNQGWMATNTWVGGGGNRPGGRPSKTFTLWRETIKRNPRWKQEQTRSSTSVRTGTKTWKETKEIKTQVGDKQIDSSSISFMRSIPITINADKLRPDTLMHFEFDGVNVDDYITDYLGNEVNITTDGRGRLRGVIFNIPADSPRIQNGIRFHTGTKTLKIQDSFVKGEITTECETEFTSAGTLNTRQRTIMSTLQSVTKSSSLNDSNASTATRTVSRGGGTTRSKTKKTIREYYDPVAESFMVSNEEGGVFIDSIDLYFATKDMNGTPVRCELREMINGYPTFDALPGAGSFVYPEDVFTSDNGTSNTRFTFSDPVYLLNGVEYCFVVISDSLDYNIWISELGSRDRATNTYIATQDHLGSMFTSQNNSTWTPEQTKDVKFKINKCVFDITSGASIQMNMKAFEGVRYATGFTTNIEPMLLPGTETKLNVIVNQDIVNIITDIEDGEDYQFESRVTIDGAQSSGFQYTPLTVMAEMSSTNTNISPVWNNERLSLIIQNNVVFDGALNDKHKKGVYISKMVQLSNGADDLQMWLSVQNLAETYIKVFYDTGTTIPRYIDTEAWPNITTNGDYNVNDYEEEYAFIYNDNPELQITNDNGSQASWNGIVGNFDSSAYVDGDGDVNNISRMHLVDISHMKSVLTNSFISKYDLENVAKDNGNINSYEVGDIWFGVAGDQLNKKFYVKIIKEDGTYDKEEVPVLKIVSQVATDHPDYSFGLAVVEEDPITWREMKDAGNNIDNENINTDMEFIEHMYSPLKKINNEFKTFRIKIELYTIDPVYMPAVRELRVLAVT